MRQKTDFDFYKMFVKENLLAVEMDYVCDYHLTTIRYMIDYIEQKITPNYNHLKVLETLNKLIKLNEEERDKWLILTIEKEQKEHIIEIEILFKLAREMCIDEIWVEKQIEIFKQRGWFLEKSTGIFEITRFFKRCNMKY